MTNPAIQFSFPQTAINHDTGTYEVKHILQENITTADTCISNQKFYNYYAYDDGTAETGYGLYGPNSLLAYKFTMPTLPFGVNDTLKAIQIYFLPVLNLPFLRPEEFILTVWADQGGQPGTIIYQQRTQHVGYKYETPDRFLSYGIDSGTVVIGQGQTYYIGWQQLAPDRNYIGMDFNDDHHDKIFYNTSGPWYTSIFPGSLMMRPVFADSTAMYDASGIAEENTHVDFSIYPNPGNDFITISGLNENQKNCKVSVMDISGREVIAQEKLNGDARVDVSGLSEGLYLLQLKSANGEIIGTKRLMIAR